ncbi:deoxyhypusine synthase [Candidatus Geothermarchaeota archaeon ex4572_27]|nr:MAG: deoxyhypusine synthase [Candidatus Geothermarchaeota archaeon ex4572_27]
MRVADISLDKLESVSDLISAFRAAGGFMARHLAEAYEILREALLDEETTVFMSFTANVVATGLRGVIRDMIRLGWVDVVITTCGSWDHDIARALGAYEEGSFGDDDRGLRRMGIHRLGNIRVPRDAYGPAIERYVRRVLEDIHRARGVKEVSTHELSWELGKGLGEDSFLHWAWRRRIPVIVPGPYDGAVGSQIWVYQQVNRDFKIDMWRDEQLLSDAVFEAKRAAAIIVGGGISKHHLLWWNQFREGLDYAVQITTAVEWDGSLSGARLDEAISWGKVREGARQVTVWADATIALPILAAALYREVGARKRGPRT